MVILDGSEGNLPCQDGRMLTSVLSEAGVCVSPTNETSSVPGIATKPLGISAVAAARTSASSFCWRDALAAARSLSAIAGSSPVNPPEIAPPDAAENLL